MQIRPARPMDLAPVQRLLREAQLPWEDVARHFGAFLVGTQGAALCDTLLGEMRRRGLRDAYLLTTTARRFFTRQGFAEIARERAPAAIRATREFAELCPANASVMHRAL